jgi:hypothetical protein
VKTEVDVVFQASRMSSFLMGKSVSDAPVAWATNYDKWFAGEFAGEIRQGTGLHGFKLTDSHD